MCVLCLEFQKEKLNVKQISQLFSELLIGGDQKHLESYERIADNISNEYRNELNKQANDLYTEESFDPW